MPYASPEQLAGEDDKLSPASDLFSLGIVFHELLTGKRLFAAGNRSATSVLVMHGDVAPPSKHVPGIPSTVDALCLKLLARNIEERFSSASDVIDAAQAIMRHHGEQT